jgi:hypothetical protein
MDEPLTKRHPMIDMAEFERRLCQSSGNQTNDDPLAELARVISGQKEPLKRVAEPQSQNLTEARQVTAPSPEAQKTEAQEPDALQSLDGGRMACQDSGTVKAEIASRRSLYVMILAAIAIVGVAGIGASLRFRSGALVPPEIATISEDGPAKPQFGKTNRSDVPNPNTSILDTAPQPSPVTAVNNVEQPVDPSQPRETVPAAEVAASPEQIETQVQPPSQPASIEPEKMNTASIEQHDAISSDAPRAKPKIVPLPVPRPAALAKAPAPETAARVAMPRSGVRDKFRRGQPLAVANTAKPKRPASPVTAQPIAVTSATEKRGWVNFGTFQNGNWVEKQFEISGAPMRPPRPGDTLTATIPVNVRRGPIEGLKVFGWQKRPVACDPTNVGEKFTVLRTVEIAPGYFWTEIKNSVQCTK